MFSYIAKDRAVEEVKWRDRNNIIYSYDLRTKVIELIERDGLKIYQAAKLFNNNHNTITVWLKRKRLTEDYKALPNKPPGSNHRITD